MLRKFRGRERQEVDDLISDAIRLAVDTLRRHREEPLLTSPKEVLMAGQFLYMLRRDEQ